MNRMPISLGLLVAAAAALMLFASSASATTATAPAGTTFTGEIKAESEGHVILDNPIAEIACASTVTGSVSQHGSGVTLGGNISSLTFTSCTNSWHATVVSGGSIESHSIGSGNSTLTSSGATVELTRFGIACRYATSSTDIGTGTAGEHGTVDIKAAIPFHSGSGLCGSGATTFTGSYKDTTPTNLSVDS